jgi:hypothetical protein
MPIQLKVSREKTATVNEPRRDQFADNLSGALQYTFVHALFKALELFGEGLGSFGGGILVGFMESLEPSLVTYARPLIDLILDTPGLDAHLRNFFSQLREPAHEGASAILGGLSSQAGSAVVGNLLGVLLEKPTQLLNAGIRPTLPDVNTVLGLWVRKLLGDDAARSYLSLLGFPDNLIQLLRLGAMAREGVGDLLTARIRGNITQGAFDSKISAFGFTEDAKNLLIANSRQLITVGEAITGWFRGIYTEQETRLEIMKLGYTEGVAANLMRMAQQIPGASDLVRMGLREAWDDNVAREYGYDADFSPQMAQELAKQGFSADWAKRYWRAHWDLPSPQMGYEMLHRGYIDVDQLNTLLRILDYPQFWRENLVKISYNPLTRVDTRRMYGLGVLDRTQVKRAYLDLGYDETKAEWLTEFTVRYEDRDGESKPEKYKELTQALILAGYNKGVITETQARAKLKEIAYTDEDIEFLISLATARQMLDALPDYQDDYRKDIKALIERTYIKRLIDRPTAVQRLQEAGFPEQEAEYIITIAEAIANEQYQERITKNIESLYVTRSIDRTNAVSLLGRLNIPSAMQNQLIGEWDIERETRTKHLSASQYDDLRYREIITVEEYKEALRSLDYTDRDVELLYALETWAPPE